MPRHKAGVVSDYKQAAIYLNQGYSREEICTMMGRPMYRVNDFLKRAGIARLISPNVIENVALHKLPQEIKTWLSSNTPEGSTVDEVVMSILIDAYHEEVGNG
jgi:hypothetical protein